MCKHCDHSGEHHYWYVSEEAYRCEVSGCYCDAGTPNTIEDEYLEQADKAYDELREDNDQYELNSEDEYDEEDSTT